MVSAAELARDYDLYVSTLWRGDADAALGAWLGACWRAGSAPHPAKSPAAISPCGGSGRGIQWYDTPTGVLGLVLGVVGCYFVPPDNSLPTPYRPRKDDVPSERHVNSALAIRSELLCVHELPGALSDMEPVDDPALSGPFDKTLVGAESAPAWLMLRHGTAYQLRDSQPSKDRP